MQSGSVRWSLFSLGKAIRHILTKVLDPTSWKLLAQTRPGLTALHLGTQGRKRIAVTSEYDDLMHEKKRLVTLVDVAHDKMGLGFYE